LPERPSRQSRLSLLLALYAPRPLCRLVCPDLGCGEHTKMSIMSERPGHIHRQSGKVDPGRRNMELNNLQSLRDNVRDPGGTNWACRHIISFVRISKCRERPEGRPELAFTSNAYVAGTILTREARCQYSEMCPAGRGFQFAAAAALTVPIEARTLIRTRASRVITTIPARWCNPLCGAGLRGTASRRIAAFACAERRCVPRQFLLSG
jgi:hypothetical protein